MIDLEDRQNGLGGSEISAVVGYNRYCTREQLLAQKLGASQKPEEWIMWWGSGQEPFLFETLEHRPNYITPKPEGVREVVRSPRTLRHTVLPWAFSSPDGYVLMQDGQRILLELKTAPIKREENWGKCGTSDAPAGYLCQVLWNMAVARSNGQDISLAWILVLFGNRAPQLYPVPYDEGKADWLLLEGERFWREVLEERKKRAA